MKKSLGVYIHIPFCAKKCPYCDFYSTSYNKSLVEEYVTALCNDIKVQSETLSIYNVDSVYFGGGTPSLLTPAEIGRVLTTLDKELTISTDIEITMEANPNTINIEKLRGYYNEGVNRISFGVQSLNEDELTSLGRTHSIDHSINAINNSIRAGFSNISTDLMLGTPHQTHESVRKTLEKAVTLPITHISAYMLKVEENTDYYSNPITDFCVDEDDLADIYLDMVEFLGKSGFPQYEISNFAKAGYESRHNLKYWECHEYVGLGASSHSYMMDTRYSTPSDIHEYIRNLSNKNNITDSRAGELDEEIMLKLRLSKGIPIVKFTGLEGQVLSQFEHNLKLLEKMEYIQVDCNILKLTPKGFLISNTIINKLLNG